MFDEQQNSHVLVWQFEEVKIASAEMKRLLFQSAYTHGPAKAFAVANGGLAGVLQFYDDVNGTPFVAETLKMFSENLDHYLKLAAALPESEVRQ